MEKQRGYNEIKNSNFKHRPQPDLINTYTSNTSGTFGNALYPPSIKEAMIDSTTYFFMVWQDISDDPNGNIYFIKGKEGTYCSTINNEMPSGVYFYFIEYEGHRLVKKMLISN